MPAGTVSGIPAIACVPAYVDLPAIACISASADIPAIACVPAYADIPAIACVPAYAGIPAIACTIVAGIPAVVVSFLFLHRLCSRCVCCCC